MNENNSQTGSTAEDLQCRRTLHDKQIKKCPSFDVLERCYAEHPSIKPVSPKETGALPTDYKPIASDIMAPPSTPPVPPVHEAAPPAAAAAPPAAAPAQPAAAAQTKTASSAAFSLKASKQTPKMDLGNAYLEAQTFKALKAAEMKASDTKVTFVTTLSAAGKTYDEIKELLKLLQ